MGSSWAATGSPADALPAFAADPNQAPQGPRPSSAPPRGITLSGITSEFKEFAVKGSVVDMAVGIILGAAFSTVVKSLVEDVIMPPIGMLTAGVDVAQLHAVLQEGTPPGPYASLEAARQAGAITINYGAFLNNILAFLIVAVVLFLLIRQINRWRRRSEDPGAEDPTPTKKTCPFCASSIPVKAQRCPACTSELDA